MLSLDGPRQVSFRHDPERAPAAGEIRLEAIASAISHGTEVNLYRGNSAFSNRHFDPTLRLFVDSGGPGSGYPMELGYEMISRVAELGPGVRGLEVGDLVHTTTPHGDGVVINADEPSWLGYPLLKLPKGMVPETALFTALCCVGVFAVHDAAIKLGDVVVVFGLGVVGLMTMQLARLQGAALVIGIDPIPLRRRMADTFGADMAIDPSASDVAFTVKDALGGSSADVSIETSGADRALHDSIACVGIGGRVVAAAFYQGGAPNLHLGEEWHHNRPTLVSSMGVWDCPHRDHPHWDRHRVARTALDLLHNAKVRTEGLITHWFEFTDAAEAYRLVDQSPEETIKVALRYPVGT